eukprot:12170511-Ditylum_brightwellii.AAC.1
MVRRNPQAVHTRFFRSLQHEWAYLQRVIEVDPEKYVVLDSIIQSELVPALFSTDGIPVKFDQLFTLLVKEAGLGILSPMVESSLNQATSLENTKHLDHDWTMNKGQWEGKKHKSERYEKIFSEICKPLLPDLMKGLEERAKILLFKDGAGLGLYS